MSFSFEVGPVSLSIDVPNVPGVPALISYAENGLDAVLTSDSVTNYGGTNRGPRWGLYSNGKPVITAESVVSFDFRREWAIASYPIEGGGFESYDRVDQPFQGKLQFAGGSTDQARRELLSTLAAATRDGNMTKYDIVTPDLIYTGVNIDHYNYDRKAAQGAKLLLIDVFLVEIREQNTGDQNSKTPSASEQQPQGTVQTEPVPLPTPRPSTPSIVPFAVT